MSLVIQEGTFRKIEDGLFIQIGERLPDGRLGGIFVADSRTEGTDLVYYAKTGTVVEKGDETVLIMQDGEIHRKLPGNDISVIRFLSYAFDLSVFTASNGTPKLYPEGSHALLPLQSEPRTIRSTRGIRIRSASSCTDDSPNGSIPLSLL